MKRFISFVLAFAVLLSLSVTASASNYNDFLNIKDESQYDMEAYYQELWINYEANTSYLWNYICEDQCNSYVQIANHFEGNGWYEFATRWTEQELTKERYVEILVNLMSLMDYTTHDMIEKQVDADTLKTFGDYALDVSEILVGTVTLHSAFGSRVTEPMKKIATATGLTSGAAELTVDTIEAYKYLDWTLQTYEHHDSFLTAIIQNTDDELLQNAAIELSDIVNKTFYCKINAVSDISESTAEYIGKDVFFDTIVLDKMLANASILDLSESDFAILDLLKNTYSVFTTSLSYIQDWSVFISDMLGGSSDVMNRYNEMRALTAIREALIKQAELYRNNIKNAHNYVEIGKLCVLMKDLVCINYRGEYCVHEMLVHDGQAFSLVVKWNGEKMTYDEIFERTKLYTAAYIDAIDSIFPDPERYHLEETTAPPNEYSSFTDVIENTKSRIEYGSFSENQKEFCRGDFFEIDGRNALVLMYHVLNGSDLAPGYYIGLWVENSDGTISCLIDQLVEETGDPDDAYVIVDVREIDGKMYLNPYVRITKNNTDISKSQYYLIGDELVLEYDLQSEAPFVSMGDGLIQHDDSKSVYYLNQEQIDRSTFYSTQDKLNIRTYILGLDPNWSDGLPPQGYTFEELLAQLPEGTAANDSDTNNSSSTEATLTMYADVVRDCMEICGFSSMKSEELKNDCRGLLYDVDGDDKEELVLQYISNHYEPIIEVWDIENGVPTCMLSSAKVTVGSSVSGICLYLGEFDGHRCLIFDWWGAGSSESYSAYEVYFYGNNTWEKSKTITKSQVESVVALMCQTGWKIEYEIQESILLPELLEYLDNL